jgi:hypothetical protein
MFDMTDPDGQSRIPTVQCSNCSREAENLLFAIQSYLRVERGDPNLVEAVRRWLESQHRS